MPSLPINKFKRALAAHRPQVGLWLTLESTLSTEIAAGAGYDWLLLDMEHTGLTLSDIGAHVTAARGGTAELVVRIPSIDPVLTKNLLDSGVRSLMYPFVQNREEAQLAVAATRYPPHGVRGVGGGNRANAFSRIKEYNARYAEEQCIVVQVESPTGLAAIAEIGTVDGLDGIFIGPNDLAANMGLFSRPGEQAVKDAIASGLKAIKATGKAAGLLDFAPAQARAYFAEGFDFIAVGSDGSLLIRRTDELRAEFPASS